MNSDVDEGSTRSEDISLDYDFFHSHLLEISCGNDYTAKVIPRDINVWTARLFLGDADGFSILYYQDVDSLVYWANEAAYRWGLRGIAIWSLGQEDMRLWGGHAETNRINHGNWRLPCGRPLFSYTNIISRNGGINMKELWNTAQVIFAAIGGWLGYFLGGNATGCSSP